MRSGRRPGIDRARSPGARVDTWAQRAEAARRRAGGGLRIAAATQSLVDASGAPCALPRPRGHRARHEPGRTYRCGPADEVRHRHRREGRPRLRGRSRQQGSRDRVARLRRSARLDVAGRRRRRRAVPRLRVATRRAGCRRRGGLRRRRHTGRARTRRPTSSCSASTTATCATRVCSRTRLAFGKAVVCSDGSDPANKVREFGVGCVFEPGNASVLAAAVPRRRRWWPRTRWSALLGATTAAAVALRISMRSTSWRAPGRPDEPGRDQAGRK